VHRNPDRIFDKGTDGEVVVPQTVMDLGSGAGQFIERDQDPKVIWADGMAVFDPEIKEVSHNKEVGGPGRDLPGRKERRTDSLSSHPGRWIPR